MRDALAAAKTISQESAGGLEGAKVARGELLLSRKTQASISSRKLCFVLRGKASENV